MVKRMDLDRGKLAMLYREISRRKLNKYKHQFPRMRESQIVAKIIKQWQAMGNQQKRNLYKQYTTEGVFKEKESESENEASIQERIKKQTPVPAFQSSEIKDFSKGVRPYIAEKSQIDKNQQNNQDSDFSRQPNKKHFQVSDSESGSQLGVRKRKPRPGVTISFYKQTTEAICLSRGKKFEKAKRKRQDTYDKFYQFYHGEVKKQHPNWSEGQITEIIKLLWKKRCISFVFGKFGQPRRVEQYDLLSRRFKHQGLGLKYLRHRYRQAGYCGQCNQNFCFLDKHMYRSHPYLYDEYVDNKYGPLPNSDDFCNAQEYQTALLEAKKRRPIKLPSFQLVQQDMKRKPKKGKRSVQSVQTKVTKLPRSNSGYGQTSKRIRLACQKARKASVDKRKQQKQKMEKMRKNKEKKNPPSKPTRTVQIKSINAQGSGFVITKMQAQSQQKKEKPKKQKKERPKKYKKQIKQAVPRNLRSKSNQIQNQPMVQSEQSYVNQFSEIKQNQMMRRR